MVDLLKRWAASGDVALQDDLEGIVVIRHPRCYLHTEGEPDGYCVVHSGFWHGFRVDPDRPADRAHILAAVIEAIEARGFGWAVVRGNGVEGVTAMVEGGSVHRTRIAPTPAAALLSAYLAALARHRGES